MPSSSIGAHQKSSTGDEMFTDFTNFAYQLAFFTDGSQIPADEFSVSCRKRLKIGTSTPSFIPDFPGMPDDVPRLQIQSENGYNITLRNSRVDLIVDLAFGLSVEEREVFFENARTMIGILREHDYKFSRVGLVKRYLKVMDDPAKFITDLFGGHGGPRLLDFAVNGVVSTNILGRSCYDIYNYSAAVIRGSESGVVAYRDLVSIPGEVAFSHEEAERFVEEADSRFGPESLSAFVGDSHE